MIFSRTIKQRSPKNWRTILCIITTSLAITSIFLYYFGLELHAIIWHMSHPEPLEWNKLEITVPKKFISRTMINKDGKEKLQIYSLIEQNVGSFFLDNFDAHLNRNFNFEKYYNRIGYQIIEKKEAKISGHSCVWIKLVPKDSKKDENEYIEAVYFKHRNIVIIFIGDQEKRYCFENFISTVRDTSR